MEYPNKIYICEYSGDNEFNGKSHFVILVAASSSELAKEYVKEKIGFDCSPTWIMNAFYPNIYISSGEKLEKNQVKILSNNTFHSPNFLEKK
jgi:hypothetical protein